MAPKIKRYADGPEVREWALSLSTEDRKRLGIDGLDVSNRGRFHSKIVQAFNRAHRQEGIRYVPIGRTQPRTADVFEENDPGDGEEMETYRKPQQAEKQAERPVPPTPLPVPREPLVAPPSVMELLRNGQNVVVVYVPVEMAAAV